MSTTERSHDATDTVDDADNGAAQTVKLDAAALRKLVVATVLTIDDSGSGPQLAAPGSDAGGAEPPERL